MLRGDGPAALRPFLDAVARVLLVIGVLLFIGFGPALYSTTNRLA
jgi:hypothetical protein